MMRELWRSAAKKFGMKISKSIDESIIALLWLQIIYSSLEKGNLSYVKFLSGKW